MIQKRAKQQKSEAVFAVCVALVVTAAPACDKPEAPITERTAAEDVANDPNAVVGVVVHRASVDPATTSRNSVTTDATQNATAGPFSFDAWNPDAQLSYAGKAVTGEAKVKKVISDRAFWLERGDGQVLGVVREDVPRKEMIDIDAGQTIRFIAAVVASDNVGQVGGTLERDAKDAIAKEKVFLAMNWRDVWIRKNAQ